MSRFGSVFIPAGVPHHNRNDGDVDEVHIEVIAPGGFLQPIATPTDSTDAKGLPYFTKDFAASGNGNGMSVSYLANRESGSVHASVYLAEMAPGAQGPPLHTHEFDQLYFVIEGALEVQIGFDTQVVGPEHPRRPPRRRAAQATQRQRWRDRTALHDPRARAADAALARAPVGHRGRAHSHRRAHLISSVS